MDTKAFDAGREAKARILLVDDDDDLLRLLSFRLEAAARYEVVLAHSGEEALERIAAALPHVMITDMKMPGMDGKALFDAVHREHPTLPVIVLTAHGSIPDAVEAAQRGVFSYLTKPYEPKALLEEVGRAVKLAGNPTDSDNQSWRAGIITRHPTMLALLDQARRVAEGEASVLILGESGSGKELLAKAIHLASPRRERPFLAFNCSAIPEQLLESELFGYLKGAFTGASQDRRGLFQEAEGGTLFLDEIGDMPSPLQVKLLRVIQEREIRPLGGTSPVPVDVRIISATLRNLEEEVAANRFRIDLFYRLNVVTLTLPSLAERPEDIPLLAGTFLQDLAIKYGKSIGGFSPEAMEVLVNAPWPGNVRQLCNMVEQAVALATTPVIPATLVRSALRRIEETDSFKGASTHFEREYLIQVLRITSGNITQAARLANRNRTYFYKMLQRHRLDPKIFKS
ncbi:MAG: response regulator [Rhodocyclaceae bacterium]|nr:MAG: response regulator [Rhodocyclaceae bacterium]